MTLVSRVTLDRCPAYMFTGVKAPVHLSRAPVALVFFWESGHPHTVEIWFN